MNFGLYSHMSRSVLSVVLYMMQFSCPPWKLVFSSPAIYGLLILSFLFSVGYFIIFTCYPTYMRTVLNYDIKKVVHSTQYTLTGYSLRPFCFAVAFSVFYWIRN